MPNFRPRRRKPLADALTEEQIRLLVEGPNPFGSRPTWGPGASERNSSDEAAVIAAFGTVTAFRVIYENYKDDLFKLAAPDRPWSWWAIEGPGIEEPPTHLRIVKWHSELNQVPPVMVRQKFLQEMAK